MARAAERGTPCSKQQLAFLTLAARHLSPRFVPAARSAVGGMYPLPPSPILSLCFVRLALALSSASLCCQARNLFLPARLFLPNLPSPVLLSLRSRLTHTVPPPSFGTTLHHPLTSKHPVCSLSVPPKGLPAGGPAHPRLPCPFALPPLSAASKISSVLARNPTTKIPLATPLAAARCHRMCPGGARTLSDLVSADTFAGTLPICFAQPWPPLVGTYPL